MNKVAYFPTKADYKYFLSFYGNNGVHENKYLLAVKWEQFQNACLNYQDQTGKIFDEFASIERECVRDQLLHEFGHRPIGYIYTDEKYWSGIEHLKPKKK